MPMQVWSRSNGLSTLRNALCRCFSLFQSHNGWNENEEFFNFTRGRFVSDEAHQVRQHQVVFDMNELALIAAKCAGARRCVSIQKCPDGQHNKVFMFSLDNGRRVVGKVPNPNAGVPHFTTASEVATLTFLRDILKSPVPQVFAWSANKDETPVAAEFIIMECMSGSPLSRYWPSMRFEQKFSVLRQLSQLQQSWMSVRFSSSGSLYFRGDLPHSKYFEQPLQDQITQLKDSPFVIGPCTGRDWVEHGRQSLDCDRGPWNSVYDYRTAVTRREEMAINEMSTFPKQDVMVCGPKLYMPTKERKLAALNAMQQLLPHLLPMVDGPRASHVWHNDLHAENIFVDDQDPSKITGIIDWQSTYIAPLFDQNLESRSLLVVELEFDKSLNRPELPTNLDTLSADERREALRDYEDRALVAAWRLLLSKKNPDHYNAIKFANTTAGNLLAISRRLFSLGEAHCLALILDLQKEWTSLAAIQQAGYPPFPVAFTDEGRAQVLEQMRLADQSIGIMEYTAREFGDLWPEQGVVEHDQYERAKRELRDAKANLINHIGLSASEKEEFDKFWPFDD